MCGIAGMLTADVLSPTDVSEVAQLGDLMVRRGPDDGGAWNDGAACALAFRRLSIIDLSDGGHQPMVTPDGEHVVVFNGELYNYRELRAELRARGHEFRSTSDTEVVLRSLAEWGTAALARFNGMFAIGWYRPGTRQLVLARDPIGIKPLSWWWSPEAFVFGSQYDQVVRHRRCRRDDVDGHVLEMYLRLGFLPAPWGLIRGTGQLEPGHWLEVSPGTAPIVRPFRTPQAAPPLADRLRGRAADDAVAAAVEAAVVRQSVSDVEMGCFLSGGVDSPLVAAHLQGASSTPIPAFTIGTEDAASDESAAATAYADELGVEHHLRRIGGVDAAAMIDQVAAAYPEPFGDYSSFPTLMVSELAAERVKVVQSGDGGDELFWGYPRFDKVAHAQRWFRLPHAARVAGYAVTKPLPNPRRPARGIMFPSIGDWYLDAHSGLRDRDFSTIAPDLPGLPETFDLFAYRGPGTHDDLMQWMRSNELRCHLPMILQKVDRASMFHSLEVRVPLLDLDLVDLAASVDPSACLADGVGKGPLRRALSRVVPAERIPLPKKGFTVPLRDWLRGDLRGVVQERLIARDPFPNGFFDRNGLAAFYEEHRSGRRDLTRGLWNLLALQLWADAHLRPLTPVPDRGGVS